MSEFTSEFDHSFADELAPEERVPSSNDALGEQAGVERETREPLYSNPLDFFVNVLGPSYFREVNGGSEFVWCPQWYKHVEALSRVDSLWRAWEYLRGEGALGMSIWWIHHADPHMRMLMAPNGAFKKCTYDGHAARPELPSLPHIEPEASLYP